MRQAYLDNLKSLSKYSSKQEIEDLCLKALAESYERIKKIKGISSLNENGIRDQFVIDLEQVNESIRHAIDNYIIIIIPESYKVITRKRPDIEFILPFNKARLVIECKKLSSAESRYVNDGLNRFIELSYAKNQKKAGMIGFICSNNFISTISKLKALVANFHIVSIHDTPVVGYKYSFQSIHKRIDLSEILVLHLFFNFKA